MNISRPVISLLLSIAPTLAKGQLDTIHYLPPMHAQGEWGPQFIYLTTPETAPFAVSIKDGGGNLVASVTISNAAPKAYSLGAGGTNKVLVAPQDLHAALKNRGLVLTAPKNFYANYRVHSESQFQAGDLTCKGSAALGRIFRIGHLKQGTDANSFRTNFIGFLATEDSTEIRLSQFNPGVDFRKGGSNVSSSGEEKLMLMAGESAVFSQYLTGSNAIQPTMGLFGALLEASKPIAVNVGSWTGGPVPDQGNDIGIDQIAPLEKVGKEYILCKGGGANVIEHPFVVAHFPNTQIWLNGNAGAVANLPAGGYYEVPTSAFSAAGNLYIKTSEKVFVYQMIGGTTDSDDEKRTAGLMFVPPINCGIPNAVDNIFLPNAIDQMRFEGGLMITAMRDSLVRVEIDNQPVAIGSGDAVPGAPDFVTYRRLNLFTQNSQISTIRVVSEGAVQVAMFGRNEPASFAAFYSGFSATKEPKIKLTLLGDGVCPDTLAATGLFDGVQWIYEDSIVKFGKDSFLIAYAPGTYVATGYLGVCRQDLDATDTIEAIFTSPEFPFTFEEPSCFGFRDGKVRFGQPYGGFPPYQFSADNGAHFSKDSTLGGLAAGVHELVVRDSTGCYNRPLEIEIGQPDSFSVKILPKTLPDPLKPGGQVILEGLADRLISNSVWATDDSTGNCAVCDFIFHPMVNSEVALTVFDTAGCPATDRFLVQVEPNVFAPNAIQPSSNLGNEVFTLFSRENLPIKRLQIFDRWGEQVFENQDFTTNSLPDGWSGKFRGRDSLPGVYVFLAEVEVLPGRVLVLRGDFVLIR